MVDAEFQNIDRFVKVLDALAAGGAPNARLMDVAARADLSRSAASRLLAGLVEQRAVEVLPEPAGGSYHLGARFAALAPGAAARLDLRRLFGPALKRIAQETQDSVWLSLRVGLQSLCIACLSSPLPIKTLALKVGERRPLGVGGGALALLAFLADDEIERIRSKGQGHRAAYGFNDVPLSGLIEQSRRLGYAFVEAAVVPGMSAVGVPVRTASGFPFAAISVSAVSERLSAARGAAIASHIGQEVRRFEAEYQSLLSPVCIAAMQRHLSETFQLS